MIASNASRKAINVYICIYFINFQLLGWPVRVHLVTTELHASTSTSILSSVLVEMDSSEFLVLKVNLSCKLLLCVHISNVQINDTKIKDTLALQFCTKIVDITFDNYLF